MAPDDLKEAISRHIPKAIICSRQAKAARLLIPRAQEIALSMMFTKVKNLAEDLQVTDFSVTQSSLDQVSLKIFFNNIEVKNIENSRC